MPRPLLSPGCDWSLATQGRWPSLSPVGQTFARWQVWWGLLTLLMRWGEKLMSEVVLKLLPCVLLEQQVLLFGDAPRTSVVAFLLRSMRLAVIGEFRLLYGPFGLRRSDVWLILRPFWGAKRLTSAPSAKAVALRMAAHLRLRPLASRRAAERTDDGARLRCQTCRWLLKAFKKCRSGKNRMEKVDIIIPP